MLEETEGKITVELSFTLIVVTFTENLQKTSNSTLAIKNNIKNKEPVALKFLMQVILRNLKQQVF